ncbi:CesT family type III secretion system chaperone [Photorhabdus temperata]|uniref:CesT family type III secretion system chaperone n=1 Tax=Photorhabdus temperata TaxID=574560 RepID=UPI000586C22C|nr:CesT family type III secretion system chaperone [Photorhabdus temperata]MCT8345980.1 CesT family type III secretion system chaperone [Photorhabdus temperata]
MTHDYHQLIETLFSKLDLPASPTDDDIYTLEVNGRFQVLIGCYHDDWLQLFCELGSEVSRSNNLFGQHWPAHVQGDLDGQAILWSQRPLSEVDVVELQAWLERFIDDIEQRLAPDTQQPQDLPPPSLMRV